MSISPQESCNCETADETPMSDREYALDNTLDTGARLEVLSGIVKAAFGSCEGYRVAYLRGLGMPQLLDYKRSFDNILAAPGKFSASMVEWARTGAPVVDEILTERRIAA